MTGIIACGEEDVAVTAGTGDGVAEDTAGGCDERIDSPATLTASTHAVPSESGCESNSAPVLGFLPHGLAVATAQGNCEPQLNGKVAVTRLWTAAGGILLLESRLVHHAANLEARLPRTPIVKDDDRVVGVTSKPNLSRVTGARVYDAATLDLRWEINDESEQWGDGSAVLGGAYVVTGEFEYPDPPGRLHVFAGHPAGTLSLADARAVHHGDQPDDQLGGRLEPLDDLDGDSLPELAFRARGAMWMLSGDDLLVDEGVQNAFFVASDDGLAETITASLGDLDGDGYGEFSMSTRPDNEGGAAARVYSYPLGPLAEVHASSTSDDVEWITLSPAGDLDGDGHAEFSYVERLDFPTGPSRGWVGRAPTCGMHTVDEVATRVDLRGHGTTGTVWDALGGSLAWLDGTAGPHRYATIELLAE